MEGEERVGEGGARGERKLDRDRRALGTLWGGVLGKRGGRRKGVYGGGSVICLKGETGRGCFCRSRLFLRVAVRHNAYVCDYLCAVI